MDSVIMDALPSIHVGIASIVFAMYSVFAIYAYQKINEFKEEIERLVNDTKDLLIDVGLFEPGLPHPFEENGAIDWRKSFDTIDQDIRFEFLTPENEDSYPTDERAIEIGNNLVIILRFLFSAYPFYSTSYFELGEITQKVDLLKKADEPIVKNLCEERIRQMRIRLLGVAWIKKSDEARFSAFLDSYVKALRKRESSIIRSQITRLGGDPGVKEHYAKIEKHRLKEVDKVRNQILSAIGACELYLNTTVVPLGKAYSNYKLFSERYQLVRLGKRTTQLVGFSIVFGVVFPLLLSRLIDLPPLNSVSETWLVSLEFFMLGFTIGPYLYMLFYMYSKLKRSDLK